MIFQKMLCVSVIILCLEKQGRSYLISTWTDGLVVELIKTKFEERIPSLVRVSEFQSLFCNLVI